MTTAGWLSSDGIPGPGLQESEAGGQGGSRELWSWHSLGAISQERGPRCYSRTEPQAWGVLLCPHPLCEGTPSPFTPRSKRSSSRGRASFAPLGPTLGCPGHALAGSTSPALCKATLWAREASPEERHSIWAIRAGGGLSHCLVCSRAAEGQRGVPATIRASGAEARPGLRGGLPGSRPQQEEGPPQDRIKRQRMTHQGPVPGTPDAGVGHGLLPGGVRGLAWRP